jgi:hypothetical protein
MNEDILEKILDEYLENKSFEEFLEEFNLTPLEVLICIYENGLVDDSELERMIPSDV